MKKDEAEAAIRHLIDEWAKQMNPPLTGSKLQSYSDFETWAKARGYGAYFEFWFVRGARADIEDWFDRALGQSLQN